MRVVFTALASIMMVVATVANAQQQRTEEQFAADLIKAVKVSVATYRANGVSGLIGKSKECHKQMSKYKFYCIYIDIAARRVERLGGAGLVFPSESYFQDANFAERAARIFMRSNMNPEQADEYLSSLTPVVNKLVDGEINNR